MVIPFKFSPRCLLEIALFILLVAFMFINLGVAPVELWDESTNIAVVRDTLDTGNIFDLQYNSSPFWEKPPLWYMATSALVKIFGDSTTVFRSISAISGVAFGLGIYYLLKKYHSKRAGILGVLVFLSIPQLHFVSTRYFSTHTFRSADLDALQLVLMLYSAIFFLNYITRNSKTGMYIGTVLSALAILVKGPFGLLPGIVAVFVGIIKEKKLVVKREYLFAFALFFTIILPWHLYMLSIYGQEFVDVYLLKHILFRSFTQLDGHSNNLLFYFKILAHPAMFISIEILVIAFIRFAKSNLDKSLKLYWMLFAALSFTLIEIVQTRLAWYLFYFYLPIIPIMAFGLADLIKSKRIYIYETVLMAIFLIRLITYYV